ncbi:hypothetical protein CR513_41861, partial [Mucuna pruriens]
MVQLMDETIPEGNRMVTNLYHVRKLIQNLGLACLKIDYCPKGYMFYCNENSNKSIIKCFKSITKRGIQKNIFVKKMCYFPLISRLKRLYSSIATTSHMRWHSENERDPTLLCHPSDGEAWKHFDKLYLEFSKDPRNVRLRLCPYGFDRFG